MQEVESRTRAIATQLLKLTRKHSRAVFSADAWEDRFMNSMMEDPQLRTQLLRFVDVFPSLRSSNAIAEHFLQYLSEEAVRRLPLPVQLGKHAIRIPGPSRRLSAATASLAIRRMARRFICGETVPEAIATVHRLSQRGMLFTIDLLGEEVVSEQEAEEHTGAYLQLLDELAEMFGREGIAIRQVASAKNPASSLAGPSINLSVKLSSLFSRFDAIAPSEAANHVLPRLRRIVGRAMELGAFINIDMEQYERRDLTLWLFEQLVTEPQFCSYPHLGIVAQAYLRDAGEAVERLIDLGRRRGTPFTVRLVKGAYWDYEVILARQQNLPIPVFTAKSETDACYECCTRLLLEAAPEVRLAIGSHNIRSIAHALAWREQLAVGWEHFEAQALFGMGDAIKKALVNMGVPLRVYTPYGPLLPGMAYLVRRLLENTSNEGFLHQTSFEDVDMEALLADPKEGECCSPRTSPPSIHRHPNRECSSTAPLPSEIQYELDPDQLYTHFLQEDLLRDDALSCGTLVPAAKETFPMTPSSPGEPAPVPQKFFNHPPLDFSRSEHRASQQEAIEQVRANFGRMYPMRIAGDAVKPAGQPGEEVHDTMDEFTWSSSTNPSAPAEIVGYVPSGTQKHAERALIAAREAFPMWSAVPVAERAAVLQRTADYLEAHRYEYNAWVVLEAGKPWREADADVCEAIDFLRYYAIEMQGLDRPVSLQNIPGETNEYEYRPLGPGAVIAPWNFPMAILTGMAAAALVAGNTVILKPAEQTPICAAKILEAFVEGGGIERLSRGALQLVTGTGEIVGEALVSSPLTTWIAFTGSVAVGLKINEVAARLHPEKTGVTRVIAEMGGKNALIVDSSADLDAAVQGAVRSGFFYAGQKCSAASRLLVHQEVYDVYLSRLRQAAESLKIGPAEDPAVQVGPVIDCEAVERIIEFGGKRQDMNARGETHQFMEPTIVEISNPDSAVAQEEIFGPVVAVLRVTDFEEAIRVTNRTRFALTAGLYSRTPEHIEKARREIDCGNLYINRPITGAVVGRQPFGGYKMSGIGSKAGGPDYLKQFLVPHTITENTMRHGFAPLE